MCNLIMPHIQGQRKCADAELAAFAGGLPWPRQLGRRLWHQLHLSRHQGEGLLRVGAPRAPRQEEGMTRRLA